MRLLSWTCTLSLSLALLGVSSGPLRAQSGNPWVEEIAPDEEVVPTLPPEEEVKPAPDEPEPEVEKPPPSAPPPLAPPSAPEKTPPRPAPGEEAGPAVDPAAVPVWLNEVEVREPSYAGILERWEARRAALLAGDAMKAKLATSALEEGLRDFGVHGQPGGVQAFAIAHALVVESRRLRAAGKAEQALESSELATRIAPDLPVAHAELAAVRLGGGDVGGAFRATASWLRALWRNPTTRAAVLAEGLLAVLLGYVAVLLVVALLLLLRSGRYLVFDLTSFLPKGASTWQVAGLVALVALTPLLVGAGPLVAALVWLAAAWVYLTRREQLVVGGFVALALAVPFAVSAAAVLWSFPGSDADRSARALLEISADELRAKLRERPLAQLTLADRVALAADAKRHGRLKEASHRWRKIVQENPKAAWAHNNLGVVRALLGHEAHAQAEFEAAKEAGGTGSVEGAFNLSLLSLRNGRRPQAEKVIQPLAARDPLLLEAFRAITFKRAGQPISHNRAFVDAPMPRSALAELLERAPERAEGAASALGRAVYGALDRVGVFGAVVAFLLVCFGLSRLGERLQPSRGCARCGSPASRRYDGQEVPQGLCAACYHAFVSKTSRVEAKKKLLKKRQVARHARKQRILARALCLWPGLGHLYAAAPFWAMALALPFGVLVAALALLFSPVPWPEPTYGRPAALLVVIALFAAVLWLVAYRTVRRLVS